MLYENMWPTYGSVILSCNYYTSEEVFLYKTLVDKWTIYHFTPQNELFLTIALIWRFSVFWETLASDWLDDVIQSTAPYVTIKCKER